MNISVADLRKTYSSSQLGIDDTDRDPIIQFKKWFDEALQAEITEPNAMHLATVSATGKPAGRIVLLKGIEAQGFTFYTNYDSRKGKELIQNPDAALTFFWPELERQVRIEGKTFKVDEETSTQYFHTRPRGSQIGAWVSPQSTVIESRAVLDKREQDFIRKFENQEIPKPPNWGGFRLQPVAIEFWQGRPSRLHDRIYYSLNNSGAWTISRLAP